MKKLAVCEGDHQGNKGERDKAWRAWRRDVMCEKAVRKVLGSSKDFSKMNYKETLIEMGDEYDNLEEQFDDIFNAVSVLMSAIKVFEERMNVYS